MDGIQNWVTLPLGITITVILLLFCNLDCYSQSSDPKRFLQWMQNDPVALIMDIGPNQGMTFASIGATLSLVSFGDDVFG